MIRQVLSASIALFALLVLASGCKKEKDTRALITVQKTDGSRVPGAYVKLYADPVPPLHSDYSRLTKEGVTDGSGQIEFDYSEFYKRGQAGFAVLDILATSDTLMGKGIIRINEEETNEETVVIAPVEE